LPGRMGLLVPLNRAANDAGRGARGVRFELWKLGLLSGGANRVSFSNQARLPAELKHITKRRKRN
jgi:hypothetical protein